MTVRFVMDTGDVVRLKVTLERLAAADEAGGILWDGWVFVYLPRVKRWGVISYV